MDCDGWEILVGQKCRQSFTSLNRLHEDDDLVELEDVEEFKKFFVLLVLLQLDVVLLQAVKGQLSFVVDVNFHRLERKRKSWKLLRAVEKLAGREDEKAKIARGFV